MKRLNILVWHVHGAYLYYLSQIPHDIYVPYKVPRRDDYTGKWGHIPWPDNVHDVPAEQVRNLPLDCVIFQLRHQYEKDQYEILSREQQRLPKIYIQHDPPYAHPTDARHFVDDPNMLLVHVTPFNDLMWDSGRTPAQVIDHGVIIPEGIRWTGDYNRGLVAINNLATRGRLLGADLFERARREVEIDLVGMAAEAAGGLGEVIHKNLTAFMAPYRFFFNPCRYTSLSLAMCEAMMVGLPIIGMATTEVSSAVQNGITGYADTDLSKVIDFMKVLVMNKAEAKRLSDGARKYARERFNINRFINDWNQALVRVGAASKEASLPLQYSESLP